MRSGDAVKEDWGAKDDESDSSEEDDDEGAGAESV